MISIRTRARDRLARIIHRVDCGCSDVAAAVDPAYGQLADRILADPGVRVRQTVTGAVMIEFLEPEPEPRPIPIS